MQLRQTEYKFALLISVISSLTTPAAVCHDVGTVQRQLKPEVGLHAAQDILVNCITMLVGSEISD